MNILFLTLSRITDISQRGIYTDLVRELLRRGHSMYIACPFERRYKQPEQIIESHGAKVLKVRTLNIQKTNIIEKGIGTLLLEPQFKRAIKRHWNNVKFDLVIYSTPPITFNKVIEWQKSLGAKSYLMLKDIFPQNAVDLGMMNRGSLVWKMFRKKEETLYAISDNIGCMSPANCKYVIDNNPSIDPQKVKICPNSIELSSVETGESPIDYSLRDKYGLTPDKPLFIYGGNLGRPQGIDFLIEVLDACKDREDIHICVVGSGTESWKLHKWHKKVMPKSVTIMDSLPKIDYDLLVSTADVGMIFLDRRFTIPNFPSRLLSYLENKMPVLLATDVNSDMGKIAEANGFGVWSESGDIEATIANINKLASDSALRRDMGKKGYQFLLDNYTIDKTADAILKILV